MLRVREDGAIDLDILASPRSSRDAIGEVHGERLRVRVKAPPVDGRANAAIVQLLAKRCGVSRREVELVAGQTGKRKTVRLRGLDVATLRSKLGVASFAALSCLAGCNEARELPITVLMPEETSDLERADNASLVLRPSGEVHTFTVDGLDFELELEGEPNTQVQQLELYLAEGDELLAWGSTVDFATAGPDIGMALFLGRPGLLSTWPERLEAPDPNLLAAEALGRGMLLVQADGDTFLLNHYTFLLEPGARLPDTTDFEPGDGALGSAADGAVVRMAWELGEPHAWRYDPSADSWAELPIVEPAGLAPRPGAAPLLDPDRTRVYLLGGGGATDAIAIDLIPSPDSGEVGWGPVDEFELDVPRDGATAMWLPSEDNPTADVLLAGGGDAAIPVFVRASTGVSVGPEALWLELACAIQRDEADARSILCLGGSRDGASTADALVLSLSEGGEAVELHESFLPVALDDPMIVSDETALYAQGNERWFRIDRATGELDEPDSAPLRARGGHWVRLANDATFLVGGVAEDGTPLDHWQVFMPAVSP